MRRRRDDPFGRVNADGTEDIPFDRTEDASLEGELGAPEDSAMATGEDLLAPSDASEPAPATSMIGGMMGGEEPTTDQMSDVDLMGLGNEAAPMDPMGGMAPEDIEVQELEAALADPNTTPEDRALIEQQIALAARRRMAGPGLGGLG